MPNWVFNNLSITGNEQDINKLVNQVNKPFDTFATTSDKETGEFGQETITLSAPVFAFHNIYSHLDAGVPMDVYSGQPARSKLGINDPNWWSDTQEIAKYDNSWYNWNIRNWGTKWDVAVFDGEKYSDTSMEGPLLDGDNSLVSYHFNTAWGAPVLAILKLSEQYPKLNFDLSYEEETGWGGEMIIVNGEIEKELEYGNQCRECDAYDVMLYCEECGEDYCQSCDNVLECPECNLPLVGEDYLDSIQ